MRTLTNDLNDCELLNLAYQPDRHGPYLIRQGGVAPDDIATGDDSFLLRKDGTWVINLKAFTLPEAEQEQFLYQTIAEVYAVTDKLVGRPTVDFTLPPDKSRAELLAAFDSAQANIWARQREVQGSRPMW